MASEKKAFPKNDQQREELLLAYDHLISSLDHRTEDKGNTEQSKTIQGHRADQFKKDCNPSHNIILNTISDSENVDFFVFESLQGGSQWTFLCNSEELTDKFLENNYSNDKIFLGHKYTIALNSENKIKKIKIDVLQAPIKASIGAHKYNYDLNGPLVFNKKEGLPMKFDTLEKVPLSQQSFVRRNFEKTLMPEERMSAQEVTSNFIRGLLINKRLKEVVFKRDDIAMDKKLHFEAGQVIAQAVSTSSFLAMGAKRSDRNLSIFYGILASSAVGLAKELMDDYCDCGNPEVKDFLATGLGGLVGPLVIRIPFD